MKNVIKIVKILLFVCFLYNLGVYDALFISDKEISKPTIVSSSAHNVLFKHGETLRNKMDIEEIGVKLFNAYYTNIPLAFILFLIWFYQDRRRFKSPFSLLISSVIYLIVLTKVIYEWIKIMDSSIHEFSKKALLETELRRTKNKFFTLLSDNEIAFIKKAISKNLSRKDFQGQLKNRGLVIQHSFILVLLITIVLTIIPRTTLANEKVELSNGPPSIEVLVQQDSSLDDDVGQDFVFAELIQTVFFIFLGFVDLVIYKKPKKHTPDIDHIPLVLNLVY